MILKNIELNSRRSSLFLRNYFIIFSDFILLDSISVNKVPRNPPNYTVLDNWVFNNFILSDELFAKVLQSPETCLSLSNNLCGKLVSSLESPVTSDGRFRVTWVPLFFSSF